MASSQTKNTTKPSEITEDAIKLNDSDLISRLPEALLQKILTLLPVEDAVPLSFVSKTWLNAWNNLPVFQYRFDNEEVVSLKELVKRVDDSLSLLYPRIHWAIIESFSLKVNVALARDDGKDLDCHLYDWVSLITRNYVKEISITVLNNSIPRDYLLPQRLFASRFLVKLHLQGCLIPSFDNKKLGFGLNYLKEISLVNIIYDASEDTIKKLINTSRKSLEKLTLKRCLFVNILYLYDFLRLSYVEVQAKAIQIEKAPNLHTLVLYGLLQVIAYDCVNIRTLRCLTWHSNAFWSIQTLISELPLLETLQLFMSRNEKIKIQSRRLRTFLLFGGQKYQGPMQVELDTPRLSTLYFSGSSMPLVTMANNINPNRKLQLHEIGKFSKKFIHPIFDNYLRLILTAENMLSLEELKEHYPVVYHAPNVRMLMLEERNPASSDYSSFLDAFF